MRDVSRILSAFIPTRMERRKLAGARCGMCGLGICDFDLGLVEVEVSGALHVRPIHQQCTALLWELIEEIGADPEEEQVSP